MRKSVNACRRLYQKTRKDDKLREGRKQKCIEDKRRYQAGENELVEGILQRDSIRKHMVSSIHTSVRETTA
jgi:hypothetical protein